MELIERDDFLAAIISRFKQTVDGEGYCFFLTGESGIGKTSLVKAFLKLAEDKCIAYMGTCDALFTPRPLAPLYDLSLQMNEDWADKIQSTSSRADLFTKILKALTHKESPVVLVFEDIHWADQATLDFIKFLSRRINRTKCLFILTYRDNEINQQHPLRNLLGDLVPDTYSHLMLTPLSRQAVKKMSDEKGYDGEDVFTISGGNPFYVNEILANYSPGVPSHVSNSVLSIYNRQEEKIKNLWQLLSVIPEGLEFTKLTRVDPSWKEAIEDSLAKKNLIIRNNAILFKHELYRRTIEESLSPFKLIELNKCLLDFFLKDFEEEGEIERIVHHAKNANEKGLVVKYAPIAAKHAASVGAHIEASKLFLTAIEFSDQKDIDNLVALYEEYAYECYLTNQIKNAIIYLNKALKIWKERNEIVQIGNCLRFLSRLWWFEGNGKKAENLGSHAIEVLSNQPSSKKKAMAYSNMSQLNMMSDQSDECISWGKRAIDIAREVNDEETIAYALNSMGSMLMLNPSSKSEGMVLLQQSLAIALKNSFHEHVARAYTALGSNGVTVKDYPFAEKTLQTGINYCEENDIDSFKFYMLGWKARLNLETGHLNEAYRIAENLIKIENLLPVIKIGVLVVLATIKTRRGESDALPLLLEAKTRAYETQEQQRIVPVLIALLEYEWITGKNHIEAEVLDRSINRIVQLGKFLKNSRFYYWLRKVRRPLLPLKERYYGLEAGSIAMAPEEAAFWEKLGCPYEQALSLFEGNEDDKRKALLIIQQLGTDVVGEKMKMEMRSSGIKNIPRGLRKSTKSNAAQLTNRELDVLLLLKKGIPNKEIAGTLFISPKTVDHHISAILLKLDVSSRAKALAEAIRIGVIN